MEFKITQTFNGAKEIVCKINNRYLAMDISPNDKAYLCLATINSDNVFIDYSTHNQELIYFITNIIEEFLKLKYEAQRKK